MHDANIRQKKTKTVALEAKKTYFCPPKDLATARHKTTKPVTLEVTISRSQNNNSTFKQSTLKHKS